MTKTVVFEHDLRKTIKIDALNVKGVIIGYYYGDAGIQYQVAYFLDGKRNMSYLYAEEISEASGKESTGFLTK